MRRLTVNQRAVHLLNVIVFRNASYGIDRGVLDIVKL
jgi:hypothetical protein